MKVVPRLKLATKAMYNKICIRHAQTIEGQAATQQVIGCFNPEFLGIYAIPWILQHPFAHTYHEPATHPGSHTLGLAYPSGGRLKSRFRPRNLALVGLRTHDTEGGGAHSKKPQTVPDRIWGTSSWVRHALWPTGRAWGPVEPHCAP